MWKWDASNRQAVWITSRKFYFNINNRNNSLSVFKVIGISTMVNATPRRKGFHFVQHVAIIQFKPRAAHAISMHIWTEKLGSRFIGLVQPTLLILNKTVKSTVKPKRWRFTRLCTINLVETKLNQANPASICSNSSEIIFISFL